MWKCNTIFGSNRNVAIEIKIPKTQLSIYF